MRSSIVVGLAVATLAFTGCFPDPPKREHQADSDVGEGDDGADTTVAAPDTEVGHDAQVADTGDRDDVDTRDAAADAADADDASGSCAQDCHELDTACTRGVCERGACRQVPVEGSCNDGYGCTTDDRCDAGRCVGSPVACEDPRSCAVATCVEPAGACQVDSSACECATAADCDDADACDGVETCVDGHCVEGTPVVCAPATAACQLNLCAPSSGRCRLEAAAAGAACDDGTACTSGDHCGEGADAGTCVHDAEVVCAAADDCHEVGVCNPLSGVCSSPTAADGALCESATGWDGEAATPGTCHVGVCQRLPKVSVGRYHACAVFYDGAIYCWGAGIGDDETRSVALAGLVPAPPANAVFATENGICAINSDGLRCWGSCLGYPDCVEGGVPLMLPVVPLGTHEDGAPVVPIHVSETFKHGCVVSARGTVRCYGNEDDEPEWGVGYPGYHAVNWPGSPTLAELGDVQLVPPGEVLHVASVAVSPFTNCVAFREGGVRCWGMMTYGGTTAVGDGYIGDDEFPYVATLVQLGGARVVSLAAGHTHFCAVRDYGDVACWGDNDFGQLGDGTTVRRGNPVYSRVGNLRIKQVACGNTSTCAVSDLGFVRCWGANQRGELGIGNTTPFGTTSTNSGDAIPIVQLSARAVQIAGAWHTYCAALRAGQIACWGANDHGLLGINSTEDFGDEADELVPQPIDFGRP